MDIWQLLERTFGWGGVVAYHGVGPDPLAPVMHVSPERLRAQLAQLVTRHSVVPLRELLERWRTHRSTDGCVAVTFDDAYAGLATHALPILRELDIPATVFVASNHAALGASYWWDDVERARRDAVSGSWEHVVREVGLPPSDALGPEAADRLRNRVLTAYCGRWPRPLVPSTDDCWRSLTFSELGQLATDARIDFGVHTLSHPALPYLPYDAQVGEMQRNHELLRDRLPRVLPVVAYPYGLYDRDTVRAAREAGMQAGLSMEGRAAGRRPDLMRIPRLGIGEPRSPQSLERRLNRALQAAHVARSGGRHPRLPVDPLAQR